MSRIKGAAAGDLFGPASEAAAGIAAICRGATVLRRFVEPDAAALLAAVAGVERLAPFRHMVTPGGFRMSVAMTNCGEVGWVTDRQGYRYQATDPEAAQAWPAMPDILRGFAERAALWAGFEGYTPDSCLINRYERPARLSLHQDRNERDMRQPIVSVSLGQPAVFLFGGETRSDRPRRIPLQHGDVVVWGGPARLAFHGVDAPAAGAHPLTGASRINLTFRKAL
ncbi:MAG: DNA oxidative demethylase AlkB [Proteobacteria bacterium]|nr:DNA oxidative demethylase AlkB [Pseudomonadota bacterium]MBI3497880.1 DNA oxidative demethylase AlkB [Pseudomonadota bacterium]